MLCPKVPRTLILSPPFLAVAGLFVPRSRSEKEEGRPTIAHIADLYPWLAMRRPPRLALLRRLFQPACGEVENNAQVIAKSSLLSAKSPQLFSICPPLFRRPPPPFAKNSNPRSVSCPMAGRKGLFSPRLPFFFGKRREKNIILRKFYTIFFGRSRKKPYICSVKLTQVRK